MDMSLKRRSISSRRSAGVRAFQVKATATIACPMRLVEHLILTVMIVASLRRGWLGTMRDAIATKSHQIWVLRPSNGSLARESTDGEFGVLGLSCLISFLFDTIMRIACPVDITLIGHYDLQRKNKGLMPVSKKGMMRTNREHNFVT
jgi:hypothetical protein